MHDVSDVTWQRCLPRYRAPATIVVVTAAEPRARHHYVTPRMVVDDVNAAVDFMRAVFDASCDVQAGRPTEVRIGDSLVLLSGVGERDAFPAFLYVYVDDADRVYRRAVDAGATVIEEPVDTPYGDRRAMVRDSFGHVFQIAHQLRA
jgi:PhnB protein